MKLLSMSPHNDYPEITRNIDFEVCNSKVFPSITGKSIIETKEYEEVVRRFQPDIIHSHLFWSELLTREICFPGVQYVSHCHDNMWEMELFSWKTLFSKGRITRFFERRWMLRKYRKCENNFIVVSEDSKKYFNRVLPKDLKKIYLLQNAIDFQKFNKGVKKKKSGEKKLIKLIYVARFYSFKNHLFLLDVVEEIKIKGFMVELLFLGNGPQFKLIKNKVKERNLDNEIKFLGIVDQVEDHLANADIYVHPSLSESFGLVFLEAMAAGLPVVCLDGKGNRDIIIQGKNGVMLKDQDPENFAQTILDIFNSKEKYETMSEFAVAFAKQFDMTAHTEKLVEFYQSILKKINIGNETSGR